MTDPLPLVGLLGAKQSGKDTAARILAEEFRFVRLAFADRMKAILLDVNPRIGTLNDRPRRLRGLVVDDGWDAVKEAHPEVRRLLQEFGVSARKHISSEVWVDPVMSEAKWLRASSTPGACPVVVSDVRFPNEVEAIARAGGFLVRVTRDGATGDAHISERALDDFEADFELFNPGSLPEYRSAVVELGGRVFGWWQ